ncbi:hypothetical protein ACH4ND_12570 [Streptomyces sp. NPDC017179]
MPRHTDEWLGELRASLEHVQRVRALGPDARPEGIRDEDTHGAEG